MSRSDIDFLLGIVRNKKPKQKRKPTTFVKRKRNVLPRRRSWYMQPESLDIDLLKPERLHGAFCGCGRRHGDTLCEHGLDFEGAYT